MKTISYKIIVLIFMVVCACDVIDQDPISEITSSNAFETADDAEAAVVGCYDGLQNMLSQNYAVWGDARGDGVASGEEGGGGGNAVRDLSVHVVIPSNPLANWSSIYVTINRTNNVLTNIPAIQDLALSESRKEQILGEAYFIRALSYFYAVRLWGDVPLILEPIVSPNQDFNVSRTNKESVLDQIESDLNEALSRVPVTFPNNQSTKGRATTGAVQALRAHVFAWRGDYNAAVTAIQAVLDNPSYTLLPKGDYGLLFSQENTSESIFELQFDNALQETNAIQNLYLKEPFRANLRSNLILSQKFLDYAASNPQDLRVDVIQFIPNPDDLIQDPFLVKYSGKATTPDGFSTQDDNLILFRLGGIILLRAEALNEIGQTAEAITLLNEIRERADLPQTDAISQAQVKQAILEERWIELLGEGHRWFDLLRNGEAINKLEGLNDPNLLLYPVFSNEIIRNPNLEQNPGY